MQGVSNQNDWGKSEAPWKHLQVYCIIYYYINLAVLNNALSEEFWIDSGQSLGFIEIEAILSWQIQSDLKLHMCPNHGYCDKSIWSRYEFVIRSPSQPNCLSIVSGSISMFCDSCCPHLEHTADKEVSDVIISSGGISFIYILYLFDHIQTLKINHQMYF